VANVKKFMNPVLLLLSDQKFWKVLFNIKSWNFLSPDLFTRPSFQPLSLHSHAQSLPEHCFRLQTRRYS
jgi:hypothetical protein